MTESEAEEITALQFAAAAAFEQCAAFATVLALHLRNSSDMSPAEAAANLALFQAHETRALQRLGCINDILQRRPTQREGVANSISIAIECELEAIEGTIEEPLDLRDLEWGNE